MALKKIGRNTLNSWLKEMIEKNYEVVSERDNSEKCHSFLINKDGGNFEITVYVRNISSAYLEYAPSVKRIQIPRLDSISTTTKNSCFFICGLTTVNEENILVVWNPQEYKYHKSFRSAYVYFENIEKAYEEGFYTTIDHGVKIYGCRSGFFSNLLENYIKNSYFEEFEW